MLCEIESFFAESAVEIANQFNARTSEVQGRRAALEAKRGELASADVMNVNLESHRAEQRKLADLENEIDRAELRLLQDVLHTWPEIVAMEREAHYRGAVESHDALFAHIKSELEKMGFNAELAPGVPAITHSHFIASVNPCVAAARNRRDDAKRKAGQAVQSAALKERVSQLESSLRASVA